MDPQKNQICLAEVVTVPIAIALLAPMLRDMDLLSFVDNEGAVSALVRGTSRTDDCAFMAELTHALMQRLRLRCWFEWIDSDSNPADNLSRAGTRDAWTAAHFADLREIRLDDLPCCQADAFDWADRLLHWGRGKLD